MDTILNWSDLNVKDIEKATAEVVCNELKQCLNVIISHNLLIRVRGLTLAENLAAQTIRESSEIEVFEAIAKAVTEKRNLDKDIAEITGTTGDMNKHAKYYIELLHYGLVEPKLSYDKIAWLSEHHPTVVLRLCYKIMELTGVGSAIVKKKLPGSSEETTNSTPCSASQKNLEKPLEKLIPKYSDKKK
jgi:hypothetical protein